MEEVQEPTEEEAGSRREVPEEEAAEEAVPIQVGEGEVEIQTSFRSTTVSDEEWLAMPWVTRRNLARLRRAGDGRRDLKLFRITQPYAIDGWLI